MYAPLLSMQVRVLVAQVIEWGLGLPLQTDRFQHGACGASKVIVAGRLLG